MNAAEATRLCKFAKAACPQQAIDQDTPAAWFVILSDLRFEDAQEALVNVVKKQPFVSPAEIRAEVRRIRGQRLLAFGALPDPPAEIGADPARYQAWMQDAQRRIGDGEVTSPAQLDTAERGTRALPSATEIRELPE